MAPLTVPANPSLIKFSPYPTLYPLFWARLAHSSTDSSRPSGPPCIDHWAQIMASGLTTGHERINRWPAGRDRHRPTVHQRNPGATQRLAPLHPSSLFSLSYHSHRHSSLVLPCTPHTTASIAGAQVLAKATSGSVRPTGHEITKDVLSAHARSSARSIRRIRSIASFAVVSRSSARHGRAARLYKLHRDRSSVNARRWADRRRTRKRGPRTG